MKPSISRVIFMCGPAGSGKSTYAKTFEQEGMTVLSFDKESYKRGITIHPLPENVKLEIKKHLDSTLKTLIEHNQDVVLDYSFWSKAMREEYRYLLEPYNIKPVIYYLKTPKAIVIERIKNRTGSNANDILVSEQTATQYYDHFEPPTEEEGEIITIIGGIKMAQNEMMIRVEDERYVVLEQQFNAPPDRVFDMFSDSKYLKAFWGPKGWELPHSTLDFRPGGEWHYGMECMDEGQETFGMVAWGKAIYQEIEEPKRIVYMDFFSNEKGELDAEMPDSKVEMDFIAADGKTKLVSRSEFESKEALEMLLETGMLEGIRETWERLEELLIEKRGL